MNAPYLIPGAQTNPTYFIANTTLNLGSYDKPVNAQTLISVDYSQLLPVTTIRKYSFRVSPGGEPQLEIIDSTINSADNLIQFFLLGGIAGRAYEIIVVTKLMNNEMRSDTLTINVLDDGSCGCPPVIAPTPYGINAGVSSDGSIIVNTSPRYFISATPPASANVLDRWYDLTDGQIYDRTSNGIFAQWTLANAGGGGGGGGSGKASIVSILPITPDGLTTIFTLAAVGGVPVGITVANTLFVSVDGVWQQAGVQYTAVNNMIQFAEPPTADANIFMLWFS